IRLSSRGKDSRKPTEDDILQGLLHIRHLIEGTMKSAGQGRSKFHEKFVLLYIHRIIFVQYPEHKSVDTDFFRMNDIFLHLLKLILAVDKISTTWADHHVQVDV